MKTRIMMLLVLVVCGSSLLGGRVRDRQRSALLPSDWSPALADVRDFLATEVENCRGGDSQQRLNAVSRHIATLRDAELFVAYVELVNMLSAQDRDALVAEQQRWLATRRSAAHAAVESHGGSLAAAEYSSAFADLTEKRLRELRARIDRQPTRGERRKE